MRVGDFDEVSEDPVVADTQRSNAGALTLARLQGGEVGAGAAARRAKGVEVGIRSGSDGAAVARAGGKLLAQQCVKTLAQALGRAAALGRVTDLGSRLD